MAKEEAVYLPTTAQLDAERRLDEENLSPEELAEKYGTEGRSYAVEGNDTSAYVGVNPEYMTYANETDKPGVAEGNAEAKLEERFTKGGAVAPKVSTESRATEGGGSTVPLVYAELSGEDFTNKVLTESDAKKAAEEVAPVDEKAAPATVAKTAVAKPAAPSK